MRHLDADLLLLVMEGKLPPKALVQWMYDHLRELCPECRETLELLGPELGSPTVGAPSFPTAEVDYAIADSLRGDLETPAPQGFDAFDLLPPAGDGSTPADSSPYDRAFQAAASKTRFHLEQIEDESEAADRDLQELLHLDTEARAKRVERAHRRFRTRMLAERMLAACPDLARQEAADGVAFAELTSRVVDRIPGSAGQTWAQELHVRAWAHKGNALRILGDLPSADAMFREIHRYLDEHALELDDLHPEIVRHEASLRHNQNRQEEALDCIGRAIRLAQGTGENLLLAGYLVTRAEFLRVYDRLDEASKDLEVAVRLVEPTEDPHLFYCAVGSQCLLACESGDADLAARIYNRHRDFIESREDPWTRTNTVYLRGVIAQGLGYLAEAEERFIEARDRFAEQEQLFSASSVALDLAEIYCDTARTGDLKELASWLGVLFETQAHHQRALVALMLFQQASAAEAVTRDAIASLRKTLERTEAEASRSPFRPS